MPVSLPRPAPLLAVSLALALGACATRPPAQSGFLSTYDGLAAAPGTVRAEILQRRDPAIAGQVTRVRIAAATLAPGAVVAEGIDAAEVQQVKQELERQLCFALSRSMAVAGPSEAGVATVSVAISAIDRTSPSASVASAVASRFIPGPGSLRLPVGRGGLMVEAQAITGEGAEAAAMVWSRGAGVALDRGSLSEIGDAHRFAQPFASDFTRWLVGPEAPERAVPDPDPCASYGPRIDLVQRATSIGTGLHLVGDRGGGEESTPAP